MISPSAGPAIAYLEPECPKLEDAFNEEEVGEEQVEHIQEVGVCGGLMVELHSEGGCVEQDGGKDGVFTEGRGGKRPQSVLERVLWNVSPDRLGIEGILYAVPLQRTSLSYVVFASVNNGLSDIIE